MNILIKKGIANGIVYAPSSKSMIHRHIVCAFLSSGRSVIKNISLSQDILATLKCIEKLGAKYIINDEKEIIIKGVEDIRKIKGTKMYCKESGSSIRFLIPICLVSNELFRIEGEKSLLSRPFTVYENLSLEEGFLFNKTENFIEVKGMLSPKEYILRGDISSQFISGMLFVLPLLDGDSIISFSTPVYSKQYIDMTIEAMEYANVKASFIDNKIFIKGNQKYDSVSVEAEGDYSNGAILDALNYIKGNDVIVKGLKKDSLQPDSIYKKLFEKIKNGYCKIDINNCPDLGPILMVIAAIYKGVELTGTSRLKIKESNRGQAMKEELEKFNIKVELYDNSIIVKEGEIIKPTLPINSHNDHRIAMSLSILLSIVGGKMENAEAVNKSYPLFYEDLKKLGIGIEKIENN